MKMFKMWFIITTTIIVPRFMGDYIVPIRFMPDITVFPAAMVMIMAMG